VAQDPQVPARASAAWATVAPAQAFRFLTACLQRFERIE
jgi:hypothetical protein